MLVKTKDVKEVVRAVDPSYRKRQVSVVAASSVCLHDLNWSGGTRSSYTAVDLSTMGVVGGSSRYAAMAPWSNPAEGATLPIPEGFAVVRTGFFCGRELTATVYVNPANLQKLLGRFA